MSSQPSLNFDICRNKHQGARNSERANDRVQSFKPTLRRKVFDYIASHDKDGATSHEIAAALGKPLHSISGRISELKKDAFVVDTGLDRNGAAVLRCTDLEAKI